MLDLPARNLTPGAPLRVGLPKRGDIPPGAERQIWVVFVGENGEYRSSKTKTKNSDRCLTRWEPHGSVEADLEEMLRVGGAPAAYAMVAKADDQDDDQVRDALAKRWGVWTRKTDKFTAPSRAEARRLDPMREWEQLRDKVLKTAASLLRKNAATLFAKFGREEFKGSDALALDIKRLPEVLNDLVRLKVVELNEYGRDYRFRFVRRLPTEARIVSFYKGS